MQVWGGLRKMLRGRGGTGRLGNFLSCGNPDFAVFWGRDLGVVVANVAEAGGSSYWVPATGDEVERKNSEGRFMAEGGGGNLIQGAGT